MRYATTFAVFPDGEAKSIATGEAAKVRAAFDEAVKTPGKDLEKASRIIFMDTSRNVKRKRPLSAEQRAKAEEGRKAREKHEKAHPFVERFPKTPFPEPEADEPEAPKKAAKKAAKKQAAAKADDSEVAGENDFES